MPWQFWIDRGGTFTDLVGVGPQGEWVVRKVLSDQPDLQEDPAVHAIRQALELDRDQILPDGLIQEVRLGTTVATNALLEAKGAPVLLFTNVGLADVHRIGDQHRPDLFALKITSSPDLASAVVEVPGRISADGLETEPLHLEPTLEASLQEHLAQGISSCAISLIHAYANPDHELRLRDWLKRIGFVTVVCSHQVCPLPRLVPRGQTTLVEASVSPVLNGYLDELRSALGTNPRLRVMGSSGALLSPQLLLAKDTILSGPAAGMVGAVAAAHASGFNRIPIVGFDMGGTSTDVFYAAPGQNQDQWERHQQTELAGLRLMAARLPIHTVAAGGGSVIECDGQRLRVGPRSAGSDPGPACYRRGGPLTITDANLLLGRLQTTAFPAVFGPSADQPLDSVVVDALFTQLAKRLENSVEFVAEGVLTIAVERMAEAIRKVSLHRGHDIRGGVLVAYGGAGGQHACRLAAQLGLSRVLMHPLAGVLSAYGMGQARQRQLRNKVVRSVLNDRLFVELIVMAEQEQFAAEQLLISCGDLSGISAVGVQHQVRLELRYASSEQGLVLPLSAKANVDELVEAFAAKYLARFGYRPEGDESLVVERLEVEVIAPAALDQACGSFASAPPAGRDLAATEAGPEQVRVHWPDLGWRDVPLHRRQLLSMAETLIGPALIVEPIGCIVLEPGWQATLNADSTLVLELIPAQLATAPAQQDAVQQDPAEQRPDPVSLELFNHRFMAIAEQMGERLRQTSRSVNIRERLDFSCALFDCSGALVANAPHIPVHLGSMGESIADLLSQIDNGQREPLRAGETVLSNDPFHGGTHLPDITAITPVFCADADRPSFFVACRGHHSDVGGLTPGSMPPFSTSIIDEGLLLRNLPFVIDGRIEHRDLEQRMSEQTTPPRNPLELLADLQAQVAANQLGAGELNKLVSDEGQERVSQYMDFVQANASEAVRRVIANLQDSFYQVELDNQVKLCVQLSVDRQARTARLDFSGTSAQGRHNFHAPLAVTKAAALYAFRCLVQADIPLNAGCFEPLELVVPEGTLLNPLPPAAVVAGNVETSQALCNLLFGAFGLLAASQGTMNNLTFGDAHRQYYETIAGGSGAGCGFDGAGGFQTHMTNSRITDPEILEQRFPVRLERFCFRRGSGGEGRWNGGEGLERRIRFLQPMTVSLLSGSRKVAPFGLQGGLSGAVGLNEHLQISGKRNKLEGCDGLDVLAGEAISIKTPGGGGYGSPAGAN
ncbi:MAG: hydantoinase B/oxoprolinase family protein [Prochlorococcus sp.]